MTPSPRTLLFALVLSALGEALPTRRGHCAGNQCFAWFQDPEDFEGAEKNCQKFGGKLYALDVRALEIAETLTVRGSYWVSKNNTADPKRCPFITGGEYKLQWDPCTDTRHGSLCQFLITEPCSVLETGGGTHVNYTTAMGFRVDHLKTFPPGTIAVTVDVGGIVVNSKHVCISKDWIPAPWNCEVLGGGCEHNCSSRSNTCTCPAGEILHRNKVSCTVDPCVSNPCMAEGEECKNTNEGIKCICRDGFVEEDGGCVNVTICDSCEHLQCDKINGVYQCTCRKGFRLAAHDPTKCELVCTEKECPARCDGNDREVCYCPDGYIDEVKDGKVICTLYKDCETQQCDHKCEDLGGGYQCLCNEGFELLEDRRTCLPITEEETRGATPLPLHPKPGSSQPPAVSSYIKTGSVLGISAFVALGAALVFCVIRSAAKRCGRFQLSSIKHQDIDIFYLQQVTSETYKRLSLDK